MVLSHLTLAALASSAMANLSITEARSFTTQSHGQFDTALVTASDGRRFLVRAPSTSAAAAELKADFLALRILSAGIRSRLPFDAPTMLGEASLSDSESHPSPVAIYDFLDGSTLDPRRMENEPELAHSIARALNAIHNLPTSFVTDAGLPLRSALDSKNSAAAVIEKAANTGYLPAALTTRWTNATEDTALWRFEPVIVNGSLTTDSFLVTGESISGVLGWAALRVGDPAQDMHWLVNANADAVFAEYARARRGSSDPLLRQRASLYSELEIARWLLHGIDIRDDAIINDAVLMLDRLVDGVHSDRMESLSQKTGPVLDVSDVEELLSETPGDRKPLARAAYYTGFESPTDDHNNKSSSSE